MLIYILKSGACLAILFLFYKLFLEKESMHVFKRFYLLGSLSLSLIIPSIVFTEYVELAEPTTYVHVQNITPANEVIGVPPALEADVLDIEPLLWTVYFLGMLFFGIKFIRNLFQIFRRIRSNPKQRLARFTQVLLQEKFPPHTFFSYIFLNRKKLEANEIPREVLLHEETHAQQKHSWDVVFVELLQVIFWVNPFVYLTKKAIKLNHEFLADQAVLKKAVDQNAYQNTLLSFLSPDSRKKYQPSLPNAINYSSIKKRFTVMKKQTSKKSVVLRSVLLLPLFALLLFSFSERKEVFIESSTAHLNAPIEETVNSKLRDFEILVTNTDKGVKLNCIGGCQWTELEFTLAKEQQQLLDNYGMVKTQNNKLEKKATPANFLIALQKTGREIVMKGVKGTAWVDLRFTLDQDQIRKINQLGMMRSTQDGASLMQTANKILKPIKVSVDYQDGASRKLMAEYNKLAKHYNEMDSDHMTIKKKDVQRLKYIYDLMSDKQRADAEPFPDFPEPPPFAAPRKIDANADNIPSPPSPPNQKSAWTVTGHANRDSRQSENGTPLPPPAPTIAQHANTKNYSKGLNYSIDNYLKKSSALEVAVDLYLKKKIGKTEDLWDTYNEAMKLYVNYYNLAQAEGNFVQPLQRNTVPPPPPATKMDSKSPPPPPAPKAPLDHVVEMAKKGATFYYEGEQVSSDKAIQLMKKNKSLNIQTTQHNTQNPKVKISKEPYVHDQSSNNSASSNINVETGNMQINGQTHFYSTKKGVTSYFNRHGQQVDKNGEQLGPNTKQNPTFYFNGQQISSEKAHRLLSNNTSIQVTNEDVSDTEYAIVLTDLNKVNNNQNQNLMNNPNSAIDLTQVISKGAVFFYNDKAISTEKALWLTQNDNIERVQVKEGKNNKPEVYFWKND